VASFPLIYKKLEQGEGEGRKFPVSKVLKNIGVGVGLAPLPTAGRVLSREEIKKQAFYPAG